MTSRVSFLRALSTALVAGLVFAGGVARAQSGDLACQAGDLAFSQPPNGTGNGAEGVASAFSDENARITLSDNFNIDTDSRVGTISWYGHYESLETRLPCFRRDEFQLSFYTNESNLPVDLVADLVITDLAVETDIAATDGGINLTRFTATFEPLDLAVGKYVVVIFSLTDPGSQGCAFRWATTAGSDGTSASGVFDQPVATDYDLAFCIGISSATPLAPAGGVDTDGDGYSDDLENALGSDPRDPASKPTTFGDVDGDNVPNSLDALLLSRNGSSTYNPLFDADSNGSIDATDATIFFEFFTGQRASVP